MPRSTRSKSESGVYHVMMRGINQMQLYYDDEDRLAFLQRLARYKEQCGFTLYAYCLMGNHFHLIIQEQDVELPEIMKRLALSYSHWFNAKYDRSGYLFQGRYKSEPVESDQYLLSVIKYIHNNPTKVGLPATAWTSYCKYLGQEDSSLVDTDTVLSMFSKDRPKAHKAFREFMEIPAETKDSPLHSKGNQPLDDTAAIAIILKASKLENCGDVALLEKGERGRILSVLRNKGLSIRQIARLTGINRNIVSRSMK